MLGARSSDVDSTAPGAPGRRRGAGSGLRLGPALALGLGLQNLQHLAGGGRVTGRVGRRRGERVAARPAGVLAVTCPVCGPSASAAGTVSDVAGVWPAAAPSTVTA